MPYSAPVGSGHATELRIPLHREETPNRRAEARLPVLSIPSDSGAPCKATHPRMGPWPAPYTGFPLPDGTLPEIARDGERERDVMLERGPKPPRRVAPGPPPPPRAARARHATHLTDAAALACAVVHLHPVLFHSTLRNTLPPPPTENGKSGTVNGPACPFPFKTHNGAVTTSPEEPDLRFPRCAGPAHRRSRPKA